MQEGCAICAFYAQHPSLTLPAHVYKGEKHGWWRDALPKQGAA